MNIAEDKIQQIKELDTLINTYQSIGYQCICTSAKKLTGLDKLQNAIKDKKMGNDERGYSNQRKIQRVFWELSCIMALRYF